VTVTVVLLSSLTIDRSVALSTTLAESAKPEAYGANVVNVILVDFRSLDTLGEIAVLAIAAVGIISLLKFAGTPRSDE
jgi:multicomponent Na+:H+ antiporter subunit A